jgi:hypothetical protein
MIAIKTETAVDIINCAPIGSFVLKWKEAVSRYPGNPNIAAIKISFSHGPSEVLRRRKGLYTHNASNPGIMRITKRIRSPSEEDNIQSPHRI